MVDNLGHTQCGQPRHLLAVEEFHDSIYDGLALRKARAARESRTIMVGVSAQPHPDGLRALRGQYWFQALDIGP